MQKFKHKNEHMTSLLKAHQAAFLLRDLTAGTERPHIAPCPGVKILEEHEGVSCCSRTCFLRFMPLDLFASRDAKGGYVPAMQLSV